MENIIINTLANKKEKIQRFLPKQPEATKKMILFKPNDNKKCINDSVKVNKFRRNFKNQTKRLLVRHKNNVICSREIRKMRIRETKQVNLFSNSILNIPQFNSITNVIIP